MFHKQMINIQKYGIKKGKSRKQIHNPARFRITQLASTSVDKFINLESQAAQKHIKRHFSCQKKVFELPLSKTINLFFNQYTLANKKKSRELQKIMEGQKQKIYNNKKKNYSKFIKQSRLRIKSTAMNEFINIQSKPRPISNINFNQTLFFWDANLITRKRKSIQKNREASLNVKTEAGGFTEVVVLRPKELSKIEKNAFRSFIDLPNYQKPQEEKNKDNLNLVSQEKESILVPQNLEQQLEVNARIEEKKERKSFLLRTHSEQSQMKVVGEHFVPFKRIKQKRKPFTFALFQKQNKPNQQNNSKLLAFKDFLWKINYSNGLYVKPSEVEQSTYKVFVGWGNNDSLIKNVFKRRFWWTFTQNIEQCNFVWSQLKIPSVFARQTKSQEKCYLLKNKQEISQEAMQQVRVKSKGHYKIFNFYDMVNWILHEENNKPTQVNLSEKTYKNRSEFIKCKQIKRIQKAQNLIVHNHFVCNGYIGNKKALFYNLKIYNQLRNKNVFEIIPFTIHISKGIDDQQWAEFKNVYQRYENEKKKNNIENIWIMKPGENTNRGTGITVCQSIEDIRLRLKSREKNKDGSLRTFIIQKYIEKPLLYNERKFDIRHYLLMTCVNGRFKAYWYNEGYIRTSSSPYSLKRVKNVFAHLTNDAIQKNSEDYGKFEPGNKISYQKFDNYLVEITKGNQLYFTKQILPKMKQIAANAVRACFLNLDSERKQHNFQLLGMDFMIDAQLKPWLIEINTNPCLETNCPLLTKIIPKLIQQCFQLCLDPLFPPPNEWTSNKNLWISENVLENNPFELIFDQETQGQEILALMGNTSKKILAKIGELEEQQIIQETKM